MNAASEHPECVFCVCVCGFRALPVMFAVTLDLRIFANNVRKRAPNEERASTFDCVIEFNG